jgi:excisionase family DNA binding protein
MSTIFTALLTEATEDDLQQLAQLLTPFLDSQSSSTGDELQWLDVKQAAAYLACNPQRLYSLKSAGRIPHHKDGSRLLFNRRELDAYIRAGGAIRP